MSSLGDKVLTACIACIATIVITAVAGVVRKQPTVDADLKIMNARVGRLESDTREILQFLKPETRYRHGQEEADDHQRTETR